MTSYTEFLNEGLFRKNKYRDIFEKLEKICNETEPSEIVLKHRKITINKKLGKKDPINDPYQEEIYEEENIKIEIEKTSSSSVVREYDYFVYINNDRIEFRNNQAKELYNILLHKYENKKQIEKEERVRKTLQKL